MDKQNYLAAEKPWLKKAVFRWYILMTVFTALSPQVFALDPPPGGGYPGQITALGQDALFNQTDDRNVDNTAIGFETLYANTLGGADTAVGAYALHDNTSGEGNTAVGDKTLYKNITGSSNIAIGAGALTYNTSGGGNTAVGNSALILSNADGNTAIGYFAQFYTTSGEFNTAVGQKALTFTTTGSENVAIGYSALNQNATGSYNIGIGAVSGSKITTGSHNIEIGNQGIGSDNRVIRIGESRTQRSTYIAGISGVTVAGGVSVIIDDKGHVGTVTSSSRYKEAIKPMAKSSEAILSLKPVSFRYKHELDPQGIPQFGLVAEEVAKVDPDLVARDDEGKPYTVRYEAVNAMLLNEFLKEHQKVEEQSGEIANLKTAVLQLQSTLEKINSRDETNQVAP